MSAHLNGNTTWLEDKAASLGITGQALSAAVLGALVLFLILLKQIKPPSFDAPLPEKAVVEVQEKEMTDATPDFAPEIQSLDGFDWTTVERNEFRPFKPIYHITMALRNVTQSELITIDQGYVSRLAERKRLIDQVGAGVHGIIPDGRGAAAVRELYTYLLRDHLPRRFPNMFTLSVDKSTFTNHATGRVLPTIVPTSSDPTEDDALATQALRDLAETVEEDLFFLTKTGETHQCVAFACCFPSGFDPSEKLGKGLGAIHAPVPSYDKIGPSMERFFSKMEAGKPVRRLNWSVQTHNELYNTGSNHIHEGDDDGINALRDQVDINNSNLRIEMQTLSRLPQTNALLFSFKTYLTPVTEVKAEGSGPAFADAIEGLEKGNAPGMWRYKAAIRWGPPVCEYLRS